MRLFSRIAMSAVAVTGLIAISGEAYALPCTTAGYVGTYSACSGNAISASTVVTSAETVGAAAAQTAGIVSDRISALSSGASGVKVSSANGETKYGYSLSLDDEGKAAGNGNGKVGLWFSGAYTNIDNNKSGSNYDGDITAGVVGIDYKFRDNLLAGVALGYENSDLTTTFNAGTEDSSGWTVAPYALFQVNKTFSVDATVGYSKLNYDVKRTEPSDLNSVTGTTDAKRWFGAANVNGDWVKNKLLLGASVGVLSVSEDKDAYTEVGSGGQAVAAKSTDLGRAHLGGDLGYDMGKMVPYVSADFRHDYNTDSSDSNSVEVGIGSRFQLGNAISASIEANTVQMKSDLDQWGAVASFRVKF